MKNLEELTAKEFKTSIDCVILYNDNDELDFSYSKCFNQFVIIFNGKLVHSSKGFKSAKEKLTKFIQKYYLLNYNIFQR